MEKQRFETRQVHAGQEVPDPATGARAVPIYQTTSFVFSDCDNAAARFALEEPGNIYGRLTNPTQEVLEARAASLEGGVAAVATASGAAAIAFALQALAGEGDHIVAQKTIYGGTANLLAQTFPRFGINTTFVDTRNLEEVEAAIQPNTRVIFLETFGNPGSDIPDIDRLTRLAHEHGLPVVVDNTFATPWLFRPLEHGADIVVHSATKFMGGHGTSLGGIIVDGGSFDWGTSGNYPQLAAPNPSYHGLAFTEVAGPAAFAAYVRAILLRDMGAAISPFNAFLILQGLETLSLRVERHVQNALQVAKFLSEQPLVERVSHPSIPGHPDYEIYRRLYPEGAASIFTFDIKGGKEAAKVFIDNLRLFSLLANVADVKSLVIHPATTTHAQLETEELEAQGIREGTIRLSIGIEHIDDILEDLRRGFKAVEEMD